MKKNSLLFIKTFVFCTIAEDVLYIALNFLYRIIFKGTSELIDTIFVVAVVVLIAVLSIIMYLTVIPKHFKSCEIEHKKLCRGIFVFYIALSVIQSLFMYKNVGFAFLLPYFNILTMPAEICFDNAQTCYEIIHSVSIISAVFAMIIACIIKPLCFTIGLKRIAKNDPNEPNCEM